MHAELDSATAAHAPGCHCPRCLHHHRTDRRLRLLVQAVVLTIGLPAVLQLALVVTPQDIVAGIAATVAR